MKQREKQDTEFLKKLGARIETIRKEKGIKQVDLADYCDLEKPNMRRLEAGGTNPTILTLQKISDGLGVTLAHLLDIT